MNLTGENLHIGVADKVTGWLIPNAVVTIRGFLGSKSVTTGDKGIADFEVIGFGSLDVEAVTPKGRVGTNSIPWTTWVPFQDYTGPGAKVTIENASDEASAGASILEAWNHLGLLGQGAIAVAAIVLLWRFLK